MTARGSNPWTVASALMPEPEYLADVLGSASDIALAVNLDGEIIAALNNDPASPLAACKRWVGRSVQSVLTQESIAKFDAMVSTASTDADMPRGLELNHRIGHTTSYPVRYSTHRIGDGAILMLGRDLQQIAETQQRLVQAQVALEKGYAERREYSARYRMLLLASNEAFVIVSSNDGRILDINEPAAFLLGGTTEQLKGALLTKQLNSPSPEMFGQNLLNISHIDGENVIALQSKRTNRNFTLSPSAFRVSGEQMVICRLDLDPPANQPNDRLSAHLTALFRDGSDGVVITDPKGIIENANEAFVEMIDYVQRRDVQGKSLAEFLVRGQIDLSAIIDTVLQTGHAPIFPAKLKNALGGVTSVEIAATHLRNSAKPVIGMTFRDMARAEAVRLQNPDAPDTAPSDSAIDLVGQAPLKDIVSATSDVVEKMCIEAALEMTNNNRVATAEILGLSRQSLYVKLRKLGLVDAHSGD